MTVIPGEIPSEFIRASVSPGDLFPKRNTQWQRAGELVGSGDSMPIYFKEWKGALEEIAIKKPAILVYQQPVRVSTDYGHRFELRDINVATDFTLAKRGKAIQLQILTWYQFPSGKRKKLTVTMVRREENMLRRRLQLAERASNSLPQLRSNFEAWRQQSQSRGTADDPRAGTAAMNAKGAARILARAESIAAEIPFLNESLNALPAIIDFGEQLHDRANFRVAFWADRNGKITHLKPDL